MHPATVTPVRKGRRTCFVVPRSWLVQQRVAKQRYSLLYRLAPRVGELSAVVDRETAERIAVLEREIALTRRRVIGKELSQCQSLARELRKRLRRSKWQSPA
jgi:hypothetical protein